MLRKKTSFIGPTSFLLGTLLLTLGCNQTANQNNTTTPKTSASGEVRAQGQILPEGGFVRLAAAPGDIVDKIQVKVDDPVEVGQELVIMRSAKLRQKQIEALEAQLLSASEERDVAIQQAKQQVTIADEKLKKRCTARRSSQT